MRRRWYLLVLGLAATAGLCLAALQLVPLTYEAEASMLLLPPKSSVGTRGNPYLYLGGLGQAVEVLSARVNATGFRDPIGAAHPTVVWTAGQDTTTTGPILSVTVSAESEAEALAVMQQVMGAVPQALTQMQDQLSVPPLSRITIMELTAVDRATAVTQTRDRAVIVVAGAGAVGSVLLTGLLDGALATWRPRTRTRAEPAPGWVVERVEPSAGAAPRRPESPPVPAPERVTAGTRPS